MICLGKTCQLIQKPVIALHLTIDSGEEPPCVAFQTANKYVKTSFVFFFSLSSPVDVYCPSCSFPDDVWSSGSVWRRSRRRGGQWRRTMIPMATNSCVVHNNLKQIFSSLTRIMTRIHLQTKDCSREIMIEKLNL